MQISDNIATGESGVGSWGGGLINGVRTYCKSGKVRVGVLAAYSGANYGDGGIQEALIYNIRQRIPNCEIHGMWGNPTYTSKVHGVATHLLSTTTVFFSQKPEEIRALATNHPHGFVMQLKAFFSRVPLIYHVLQVIWRIQVSIPSELRDWVRVCRLIRCLDLLVVAGSGQLNDQWGGPWGHPYALFKWAVAAKLTKRPFVFLSVGANCHVKNRVTLFFLKTALRIATYRSYRDDRTKEFVASLLNTDKDLIVPDLAFSLPPSREAPALLPPASQLGIVGVAPTAYQHPEYLSPSDKINYNHYLILLAQFVSSLIRTGYTVVLFYSARQDRETVERLYTLLDPDIWPHVPHRLSRPLLHSFRDLRAQIETFDYVVASRLHATLLSHLAHKPVLAISTDPKVDKHMSDLGQRSYCLDICDVDLRSLTRAFEDLQIHRLQIQCHLQSLIPPYQKALRVQYDRFFGNRLTIEHLHAGPNSTF